MKSPTWIEIPAIDIERAVTFYRELFQMELTIKDFGEEKLAHFPRESGLCGAIASAPSFKPCSCDDGIKIHFAVDNMKRALEVASKFNCHVLKEPITVSDEGVVEYGVIKDTEGNSIGLFTWEE